MVHSQAYGTAVPATWYSFAKDCGPYLLLFICKKDCGPCLVVFIYKGLQSLSSGIHLQRTASLSSGIHLQRTAVFVLCH